MYNFCYNYTEYINVIYHVFNNLGQSYSTYLQRVVIPRLCKNLQNLLTGSVSVFHQPSSRHKPIVTSPVK